MTQSTVKIIPVSSDAFFNYTISLDNVDVRLSFIWNSRTEHYHITVQLRDGSVLAEGLKLVAGSYSLTSSMFAAGLKGGFTLVPTTDVIEDNATTRRDWVNNFILSYIS